MTGRSRSVVDTLWPALGLGLLAAGWALIHARSGPFILPSLVDTAMALARLVAEGTAVGALGVTLIHAVGGAEQGGGRIHQTDDPQERLGNGRIFGSGAAHPIARPAAKAIM